jgi:hypothetical protein
VIAGPALEVHIDVIDDDGTITPVTVAVPLTVAQLCQHGSIIRRTVLPDVETLLSNGLTKKELRWINGDY